MKKLIFILTFLILGEGMIFSQSTNETVNIIEIKCKSTQNNLERYDTITVNIDNQSTDGGQATGYYNGDELKYIIVWFFGEIGKRKTEYYFTNGTLYFVQDIYYQYNRPYYYDEKIATENNDAEIFDADKTQINEQDKYYFDKGQLIQWLLMSGKQADCRLAAFKGREVAIPKEANELKEKLKK